MSLIDTLKDSIDTGEILRIKYSGGSQPGATRDISPIKLEGNNLRARCIQSNKVKLFKINRIELIVNHEFTMSDWSPEITNTEHYNSLYDFLIKHNQFFCDQGWHIEYNEVCLTLHNFFKNGKPRKTCFLGMAFDDSSYDKRQENHNATRPWVVFGNDFNSRTYGSLDRCARFFMSKAIETIAKQ